MTFSTTLQILPTLQNAIARFTDTLQEKQQSGLLNLTEAKEAAIDQIQTQGEAIIKQQQTQLETTGLEQSQVLTEQWNAHLETNKAEILAQLTDQVQHVVTQETRSLDQARYELMQTLSHAQIQLIQEISKTQSQAAKTLVDAILLSLSQPSAKLRTNLLCATEKIQQNLVQESDQLQQKLRRNQRNQWLSDLLKIKKERLFFFEYGAVSHFKKYGVNKKEDIADNAKNLLGLSIYLERNEALLSKVLLLPLQEKIKEVLKFIHHRMCKRYEACAEIYRRELTKINSQRWILPGSKDSAKDVAYDTFKNEVTSFMDELNPEAERLYDEVTKQICNKYHTLALPFNQTIVALDFFKGIDDFKLIFKTEVKLLYDPNAKESLRRALNNTKSAFKGTKTLLNHTELDSVQKEKAVAFDQALETLYTKFEETITAYDPAKQETLDAFKAINLMVSQAKTQGSELEASLQMMFQAQHQRFASLPPFSKIFTFKWPEFEENT